MDLPVRIRSKYDSITDVQRLRVAFYVETLVPKHIRTPLLKQFLAERGFWLYNGSSHKYKGFYCKDGIFVFNSWQLGHKNYRKGHAAKRGFFKADAVVIHELMHAVWQLGKLSPGFKQAVYSLHSVCPREFFNYSDAERHAQEWFCDQFPRALLFKATCFKRFRRFLKDEYFQSAHMPKIKLRKGQVPKGSLLKVAA